MEVLSSRMAPVFKGEDKWKLKRMYDNKPARQADVKAEHRRDRAASHEAVTMREGGLKRLHAGGLNSWEGVSSQPSAAARSVGRVSVEDASLGYGFLREPEVLRESSDDLESSYEVHPDASENSADEISGSLEAVDAPQKWPIIQIVAPPPWLPEGWTAVLRTRESGSKDKYYVDPVSQRRFRSKTEVNYFLQTGKSYRYKRNLALLTKPLKEDPVSLPNSVSLGNVHVNSTQESVQTLPFMSPSGPYGGDHYGGSVVGHGRSSLSLDLRLCMQPPKAEVPGQPYSIPGPKPKIKTFMEDPIRSSVVSVPKRNVVVERKSMESSQGQGVENRGKLILKLKRKTTELDEGERNGKKPRPFEVVGATPVQQGKSRSSTSDEDERYHTTDSSFRHPVSHSLVPLTHVSRRPITKAPLPSQQYQPHLLALGRPQFGGSGNVVVSSNGQCHVLENNAGSATLATTEPEAFKGPPKRESPAEQLQKLGRKLCQQAVSVFCSEYRESNTVQQMSFGLHSSLSHGPNSGFSTSFNGPLNNGLRTLPALYQQHQPAKRMRGSLPKERSFLPVRFSQAPQIH